MRVALLMGLMVFSGCAKSETYVTPLQVAPFEESEQCMGRFGTNTFAVEVLRYGGPTDSTGPLATECRRCAEGEFACPLIARRCLCATERYDIQQIAEALAGLRFDEVSPRDPVCLRLVALYRPTGEGPTAGPAEACPASHCDLAEGDDPRVQMCLLSDVGSLSEASTPIVLRHMYCSTIDDIKDNCEGLQRLCSVMDAGICANLGTFCSDGGSLAAGWMNLSAYECATF